MITVIEAVKALVDDGFDVICLDSPAPNVPSRYRIVRSDGLIEFIWNEPQLIAFVEGYRLGYENGYCDSPSDYSEDELREIVRTIQERKEQC